jgi:hypothetical protein
MKSEKRIKEGYREMAGDTEREQAAEEWCDALIGDASETADSSLRSE